MAKKKARRRRNNGIRLPLTIVAPVGITAYRRFDEIVRGVDPFEIMDRQLYELTGFSVKFMNFKFDRMRLGLLPIAAGLIAHKIANKIGINRAIASAGIPVIRI